MKALKIFVPTFFVILIINQAFYGMCLQAHCLASAFPRVTIMSVAVSALIYWVSKEERRS
jgi:tryptophan-rich sensory protein